MTQTVFTAIPYVIDGLLNSGRSQKVGFTSLYAITTNIAFGDAQITSQHRAYLITGNPRPAAIKIQPTKGWIIEKSPTLVEAAFNNFTIYSVEVVS